MSLHTFLTSYFSLIGQSRVCSSGSLSFSGNPRVPGALHLFFPSAHLPKASLSPLAFLYLIPLTVSVKSFLLTPCVEGTDQMLKRHRTFKIRRSFGSVIAAAQNCGVWGSSWRWHCGCREPASGKSCGCRLIFKFHKGHSTSPWIWAIFKGSKVSFFTLKKKLDNSHYYVFQLLWLWWWVVFLMCAVLW